MDRHHSKFLHLYAIVRFDLPLKSERLQDTVSVVSVFSSQESADAEAGRLRKVNGTKACEYEVFVTRLKG
jgi:hypothetical protein